MSDIEKAVTARLKKGNEHFEILVDLDKALEFREGKGILEEVLTTDNIFKDVKKGLLASEHEMKIIFGTDDKKKVAIEIIKHGEIQLTAEHQRKLMDEKRKQIVNLIHRNAVDPKTSIPHPVTRIENALEEAKVKIDYNKTAEQQVNDIVKKIREILPIKYETREIWIKIPAQYSGKSYGILKQYGKLTKDEWNNKGELEVVIEVPAGMQSDMFNDLNHLCKGNVESKVIGSKGG